MKQNKSAQIYWLEDFHGVAHGRHFICIEGLPEFLRNCNESGLQVVGLKIGNSAQHMECILQASDSYIQQFGKSVRETWYFVP